MGRERQKRKNKSSISRVRQHTRSKKTVLNNPIIAANWDKSQTLSQNYKRLGLAVKLNGQSGGVEKDVAAIRVAHEGGSEVEPTHDSLSILSAPNAKTATLGEARVVRDAKTGRIIEVLQSEEAKARDNLLDDPLNELDTDDDEVEERRQALANQHGNVSAIANTRGVSTKTPVVQQLESRANLPAAKHKRPQTDNEIAFIEALVSKHGSNYAKMARDMKLNYMQRSEGDLKKRIKKWQDNGGAID